MKGKEGKEGYEEEGEPQESTTQHNHLVSDAESAKQSEKKMQSSEQSERKQNAEQQQTAELKWS